MSATASSATELLVRVSVTPAVAEALGVKPPHTVVVDVRSAAAAAEPSDHASARRAHEEVLQAWLRAMPPPESMPREALVVRVITHRPWPTFPPVAIPGRAGLPVSALLAGKYESLCAVVAMSNESAGDAHTLSSATVAAGVGAMNPSVVWLYDAFRARKGLQVPDDLTLWNHSHIQQRCETMDKDNLPGAIMGADVGTVWNFLRSLWEDEACNDPVTASAFRGFFEGRNPPEDEDEE